MNEGRGSFGHDRSKGGGSRHNKKIAESHTKVVNSVDLWNLTICVYYYVDKIKLFKAHTIFTSLLWTNRQLWGWDVFTLNFVNK